MNGMKKETLHVFIIPDGNRRWAKENGCILPSEGHLAGKKTLREIVNEIWQFGVTHLTIWGLSRDNLLNRSELEISVLMEIFNETFDELLSSSKVEKEKLRVRVVGRWKEFFMEELKQNILRLENKTRDYNSGKNLTLLLVYNGDEELTSAINQFRQYESELTIATWAKIKNHSWTRFLPDVDIMIRTGNEPHLSNGALMMQMKDAHLYFPKIHWPDFTLEELAKIIDDFKSRERRFGT